MVQEAPGLLDDDDRKKYKCSVVFQGDYVIDHNWEIAIFQDLGSSFASMEAGKVAYAYGSFSDHGIQQADAEQAYIQAELEGEGT